MVQDGSRLVGKGGDAGARGGAGRPGSSTGAATWDEDGGNGVRQGRETGSRGGARSDHTRSVAALEPLGRHCAATKQASASSNSV